MANQGVSPERYYTPDEILTLDEDQKSEYFATWQNLCASAAGVRQRERGYEPTELKPGGPAPNQQQLEERIAMNKGRAGRPQARYPNQTRAAGSFPSYHPVGGPRFDFYNAGGQPGQDLQNGPHASTANSAYRWGTNRNDFITPPKGNKAIPITRPHPTASSGNIRTNGGSTWDVKTPEPAHNRRRPYVSVPEAPSFFDSEVYKAMTGSKARPRSWPEGDSDKSLADLKRGLAAMEMAALEEERKIAASKARNKLHRNEQGDWEFASVDTGKDQASKLSRFLESWPIGQNATVAPLEEDRCVFEGLLYGSEVRNPHPGQLILDEDIHTPECPEAIKEAAAKDRELSWWAVPWIENALLPQ